jgi:carboxymethylenebutenolidase
MELREVQIPSTDSALAGLLGIPDGAGPFPVVVVVHEVFGIDESMRAQVAKLASLGYLAIMPNLFSRGGARKCLTATFKALTAQKGQAFDDVSAARNFALALPQASQKVGVIGFCMGGAFALVLAGRGYDVSAVNYGRLPENLDEILSTACPIIGSFGGSDSSLKGAAATLENALTRHDVKHDVKEYSNTGHAFMNPVQAGPALLRPILKRVLGIAPAPEQAKDAWERIDAFFKQELA